jgi:uncharacterized protein YPO0396
MRKSKQKNQKNQKTNVKNAKNTKSNPIVDNYTLSQLRMTINYMEKENNYMVSENSDIKTSLQINKQIIQTLLQENKEHLQSELINKLTADNTQYENAVKRLRNERNEASNEVGTFFQNYKNLNNHFLIVLFRFSCAGK